ncbi:hypothetical protein KKC97_00340 [bacterium]|nr:hypothetical protein [bacterium]
MSDTKGKAIGPGLIAAFFFFIILLPAVIWFQFIREEYTDKMLSEVNDKLLNHELSWAGRGRDYAQYTVICLGETGSCTMLYRIPATTERVPAVVLVHDFDSTEAVFDMLSQVEHIGDCAVAAINVSDYFKLDKNGSIRTKNKLMGKGMLTGLGAVDLAIEFVRGHRIVDTTAIYLVGIGEAGVLVMPAAANYGKYLKGVAYIDADAMMSLKNWDENDFASPIGWAKKAKPMRTLMVSTGGSSAAKGTAALASAFAKVDQFQAASQNVQDKYRIAFGSTIGWIWTDRPRTEQKEIKPTPPNPEHSVVVKK